MNKNVTKEAICCIVVWYHPNNDAAECVHTFASIFGHVIVVDNSSEDNSLLLNQSETISYLPQNQNMGIAFALNLACNTALSMNYDWVMTMDMDGHIQSDTLHDFLSYVSNYNSKDKLGLISPRHLLECERFVSIKESYSYPSTVMTSLNLVQLSAFRKIGGYNNDLFIDRVDDDFCIRLQQAGFEVVVVNPIVVTHKLGKAKEFMFLGRRKVKLMHSPKRMYTMVRNTLYMIQWYPLYKKYYRAKLRTYVKYALLYSSSTRFSKLSFMLRGWRDFRKGILGPYKNK